MTNALSEVTVVVPVRKRGAKILSDEGRGVPVARVLGAEAATTKYVALIDSDVVLPDGALAALLDEFVRDGYTGLAAGQHSVSGNGYWGRALTYHHRTGRSKQWFGVVATMFEREALLEHGLDERFLSGEDIDLRWRLQQAGAKVGVSRETIVEHRYDDTWDFAKGQWLADGHGLGRMVAVHGARSLMLLGLPIAAAVRGSALSLVRRQPQWLPYFACYCVYNYAGMFSEIRRRLKRGAATAVAVS
jgi:cellulose synthase/poly-beta-1,6-N-acetylglucosamine synthase-like glycosyltransferase